MHYVIVAMADKGGLQYYSGNGFHDNALQALRFKSEQAAQRRSEQSAICRRMQESGARIEVRRVASAA